ncbi:MAG: hypothetical protein AAF752_14905, partial [Bacteroidota bacterium]
MRLIALLAASLAALFPASLTAQTLVGQLAGTEVAGVDEMRSLHGGADGNLYTCGAFTGTADLAPNLNTSAGTFLSTVASRDGFWSVYSPTFARGGTLGFVFSDDGCNAIKGDADGNAY